MGKFIKRFLAFLTAYIILVGIFCYVGANAMLERTNDVLVEESSEPSYQAHTPTGCPYGDSIPVDSPKCVAPEVLGTETVERVGK